MNKKSVGLIILWWSEAVISIRVLLFSIPVIINKCSAKTFALSNLDDQFIALVTLTAVLYFVVGVMSISGNKLSGVAHYLAAILVFALTIGSLSASGQSLMAAEARYAAPALFAVVITALNGVLGKTKREA